MRVFMTYFWLSLLLALGVATAAMRVAAGTFLMPALGWALGLLAFNAFFVLFVHRKAIGRDLTQFFLFTLIINSFRIFLLILAMIGVYVQHRNQFQPFLISVMTGYFCFLFGEILGLHALSQEGFDEK